MDMDIDAGIRQKVIDEAITFHLYSCPFREKDEYGQYRCVEYYGDVVNDSPCDPDCRYMSGFRHMFGRW